MAQEIQLRGGFKVIQGHTACPAEKPWGVATADGSLHPECGCHTTLTAALEHMKMFFDTEDGRAKSPQLFRGIFGNPLPARASGPEFRTIHRVEFRAVSEADRTATLRVCPYNVTDDYTSAWLRGVWLDGLRAKLPKGTWCHDWTDIIGRAVDFDDTPDALWLMTKFSDFDAVPRSRQAWTQLRDGDVDEVSFGFERKLWHPVGSDVILSDDGMETTDGVADLPPPPPGCREQMVRAIMYEWSPVLVGAVPGTGVLAGSVRSKPMVRVLHTDGQIDANLVASLAVQMAAGEIDLLEALEKVREAAGGAQILTVTAPVEVPEEPAEPEAPATSAEDEAAAELLAAVQAAAQTSHDAEAQEEAASIEAEADAVLGTVGRSSSWGETRQPIPTMPMPPDSDEDPGAMAQAVDAALDEALAIWDDQPDQARALVQAAEVTIDALLALLGVDDPDERVTSLMGVKRSLAHWRETRGPIASHDTAVIDESWDGPAAVAAMPNDSPTLKYCHAWVDSNGDPAAKGSYRLPHHKTKGGPANVSAVRNALARLPQSNIPDSEGSGCEAHLRKHLDKFNA